MSSSARKEFFRSTTGAGRFGGCYAVLPVGACLLGVTPVEARTASPMNGFADKRPAAIGKVASIAPEEQLPTILPSQTQVPLQPSYPDETSLPVHRGSADIDVSQIKLTAPADLTGTSAKLASHAGTAAGSQPSLTQEQAVASPVSYGTDLSGDPDHDPTKLLALYQDGRGQAQTSMDELDLVIGGRQVFQDLRTLQTRLNEMQRPTANVVNRHSTQSDHLIINELEVSQDFFFSGGRDNLRLAAFKTDYSPRGGLGINQYTGGFTSNVRLSDLVGIAGDLWVNRIEYGRQRNTLATYDAYVTLRPTDTVRIDIDANRRIFDNVTSLRLGVTTRTYSGSIDFLPTDELRLTARVFAGLYSDRNRRRAEEVEAIWRVRTNPIVEIGLKGTNFEFSRLLNNGYFNPKDYYSGEALARIQWNVTPKLSTELAGSAGAENANPGGVKPLAKGSFQAVYKLINGWSVDGEISHFTSRNSTSSGFSRTSFTAGLHYRF